MWSSFVLTGGRDEVVDGLASGGVGGLALPQVHRRREGRAHKERESDEEESNTHLVSRRFRGSWGGLRVGERCGGVCAVMDERIGFGILKASFA